MKTIFIIEKEEKIIKKYKCKNCNKYSLINREKNNENSIEYYCKICKQKYYYNFEIKEITREQ